MDTGILLCQSNDKSAGIRRGGADPKVHVLRETCSSVEHGGLTADQQVFESRILKAAEESSHRGTIAGPATLAASARIVSSVVPELAKSITHDRDLAIFELEGSASCVSGPST